MKTTNLEQKRAFMCEGGYPVVHPLDSHPKGCNVAAIEGKNVELFGTHNHAKTWELEGYWAWDERFEDHFIIWLDKMVEFVKSEVGKLKFEIEVPTSVDIPITQMKGRTIRGDK